MELKNEETEQTQSFSLVIPQRIVMGPKKTGFKMSLKCWETCLIYIFVYFQGVKAFNVQIYLNSPGCCCPHFHFSNLSNLHRCFLCLCLFQYGCWRNENLLTSSVRFWGWWKIWTVMAEWQEVAVFFFVCLFIYWFIYLCGQTYLGCSNQHSSCLNKLLGLYRVEKWTDRG